MIEKMPQLNKKKKNKADKQMIKESLWNRFTVLLMMQAKPNIYSFILFLKRKNHKFKI